VHLIPITTVAVAAFSPPVNISSDMRMQVLWKAPKLSEMKQVRQTVVVWQNTVVQFNFFPKRMRA
jgi:hypothetical protein